MPSNRLLVRNLNDGENAAIKLPSPSIKLDAFDVDVIVNDFVINLKNNSRMAIFQCYDMSGNYIDSTPVIYNDYITLAFSVPFSGIINVLYKPNDNPDISYIAPTINSGQNYNARVYAISGTPPYNYQIVSGELPSGINLDQNTGIIDGISYFPQTEQINIYVRVTDFYGNRSDVEIPISLSGSEIYGRITKAGSLRLTKAGNVRITKAQ